MVFQLRLVQVGDPSEGWTHPEGHATHAVLPLLSWNVSGEQFSQALPGVLLIFPLSQAWQSVAPFVLDVPARQLSHCLFGGSLPLVPAGHATKPEGAVASIFDPCGTTTEEDPPLATIDPAAT